MQGRVRWDTGEIYTYRWIPSRRKFDLVVIGFTASGPPPAVVPPVTIGGVTVPQPELLRAGMRVVRGPTWKWEQQDGGAGCLGTVRKDQTPGVCMHPPINLPLYIHTYAVLTEHVNNLLPLPPDFFFSPMLQDQLVKINWDVSPKNVSRFKQGTTFTDVVVVAETIASDWPASLTAGFFVVRGPTWKWEDQDGGCGHFGRVVEAQSAGVCF
jgi:hypothetical protein